MHTYEEVADGLAQRIAAGRLPDGQRPPDALPPGAAIPSANDLISAHDISRATANRVQARLRELGLVIASPGRSLVVADYRPLFHIDGQAFDRTRREDPQGRTTFEQAVAARCEIGRTDHRGEVTTCPPGIAELLEVSAGDQVGHQWGTCWAGPSENYLRVVMVYDTWLPALVLDADPDIVAPRHAGNVADWVGGTYSRVERALQVGLEARRIIIDGRYATPHEADRFGDGASALPLIAETAVARSGDLPPLIVDVNLKRFGTAQWDLTLPIGA